MGHYDDDTNKYTKKYTITMINSKDGWRFSEFHITV